MIPPSVRPQSAKHICRCEKGRLSPGTQVRQGMLTSIFALHRSAMMKITLSSSLAGDGPGLEARLKDCSVV
jgi:hypothetical protein